ncbi:LytTR family transcriptional regulator [Rhodophyticola sp. CCM32]|uniref:LytTR family DNA-binding domain-containing protein n=1 Tax=Rhodophyticola sp. CCM32 TaxID=2916397 RepID=UPI00107F7C0B|nr:LytTR family DNA-binding domain-containing protein [Rhodophyticola sp. CCM32]QBX99519.1 LytTR family transcriptional regulator [Rhodophyticola sp. CCM32]
MREPLVLPALAGLAAILALVGPFGTDRVLSFWPRLAYWGGIALGSYSIGYWSGQLLKPVVPVRGGVLLIGIVTGLGVTGLVVVLNYLVFAQSPARDEIASFIATVVSIAMIITVMLDIAGRQLGASTDLATKPTIPLLDRLPLEKRGRLVALCVEDHYVRVRTTKGEEMLLMRLSDAIREAGPVEGIQVHRSHWVALAAVKAGRRDGDRAILTMSHGADIPVSRSRLAEARAAGLLPR